MTLTEHVARAIEESLEVGRVDWHKVAKAAIAAVEGYRQNQNPMDGGCQMPKTAIIGYCAVCGSPNRTCEPTKEQDHG
jgi:hypothetical protein